MVFVGLFRTNNPRHYVNSRFNLKEFKYLTSKTSRYRKKQHHIPNYFIYNRLLEGFRTNPIHTDVCDKMFFEQSCAIFNTCYIHQWGKCIDNENVIIGFWSLKLTLSKGDNYDPSSCCSIHRNTSEALFLVYPLYIKRHIYFNRIFDWTGR